jgi:hypothetical protein
MRQTNRWVVSSVSLIGVGFIALSATIPAPAWAEGRKMGEVGTRGLPGAPPSPAQMAAFPQKFDVQGPESASFGFAVTQPGPITVDVQAQGPPVVVALQRLQSAPILQQGSGHVRLTYEVTPQDVQTSVLWAVKIALAHPALPPGGGRVSGTVMVQHPPADEAVARAQATGLAARLSTPRPPDQQARARMDAAFQDFKANFERQQQQRQAAERARNQPIIDQLRARAQVQSRNIESGGEPAEQASASPNEKVGTRGVLGTMGAVKQAPTGPLTMVPTAPPPTPIIDSLNKSQGQPKDQVIITGRNFGKSVGDVIFQLSANAMVPGVVESGGWSDTMIVVDVPDASGLFQFDGGVFIPMGQVQSNTKPFRFIPAQEAREIRWTNDMVLAQPGEGDGQLRSIYHPNKTFLYLGGGSGNDVLFPTSRLKNGWVVQGVWVEPNTDWIQGTQGGVYVADFRPMTDMPFVNARWWFDAFHTSNYQFGVRIVGPRGVPDGIVVP